MRTVVPSPLHDEHPALPAVRSAGAFSAGGQPSRVSLAARPPGRASSGTSPSIDRGSKLEKGGLLRVSRLPGSLGRNQTASPRAAASGFWKFSRLRRRGNNSRADMGRPGLRDPVAHSHRRIRRADCPVRDAAGRKLEKPFVFKWRHQSWKPWDWALVEIDQRELEIPSDPEM